MNAIANFISRNCPCCGTAIAPAEVSSTQRAEELSLEELRPYWRGLFKQKVFFTYARCPECETLYAPRFFDEQQLQELYSEMEPNMDVVPVAAIEATQRSYFKEATKDFRAERGFLEIGPDVGHIVRAAAQSDSFDHFYLFEPNRLVHDELVSATCGRPHTISTDMTDLSIVPDGSVSLAVLVHVLDHLLDPRAMIEQIAAKLEPAGRVAIVTHNERSLLRSIMRGSWPPFCLQHPELYSPASIRKLLSAAKFEQIEVKRSKNYFPLSFMVRQAAWAAGVDLSNVPLPNACFGLRLGNMLTTARLRS